MDAIPLYTTGNIGKITEVTRHFKLRGIDLKSLRDFRLESIPSPEEPSTTLGGNADIKVRYYARKLAPHFRGMRAVLFADDTGHEIPALGGEPGVHVRRWKNGVDRMEDEEIIAYAMERTRRLKGAERASHFRTVLAAAVLHEDGLVSPIKFFEGTLAGHLLEKPAALRMEGFPFASMFYVDEWNMLLGEAEQLPSEQKLRHLSHRERAIDEALPWIREQLGI